MNKTNVKQNVNELLVPLEWYLKAGIHIGTKFKNKSIEEFIYKVKQSGLKIMDVEKINKRLGLAAKFLANYEPNEIFVVCRRETGYKAVKKLAEITKMRCVVGRYLPGTITNPEFGAFIEPKLLVVSDPWHDKQAIKDALLCNIPIMALVGSNNSVENVDFAVPCNNKSKKSLPLVFYILAREYLKNKELIKNNKEFTTTLEEFTDDDL